METAALDLSVTEQLAFVEGAIAGARRVLEVGAGRGVLARQLQARAFEVTAVDLSLPEKNEPSGVRWIEGDFLAVDIDSGAFDAVVFTASLHHVSPLDAAVERARRVLAPHGLLVADDFDLEAPDEATARWFYETQELLAAAGVYDASRIHEGGGRSPLARWRADHEHHEAPLHAARAMVAEIELRFGAVHVTRGAYLYRYLCPGLSRPAVALHVKTVEERRIADGNLKAVGLRVVARSEGPTQPRA